MVHLESCLVSTTLTQPIDNPLLYSQAVRAKVEKSAMIMISIAARLSLLCWQWSELIFVTTAATSSGVKILSSAQIFQKLTQFLKDIYQNLKTQLMYEMNMCMDTFSYFYTLLCLLWKKLPLLRKLFCFFHFFHAKCVICG